MFYEAICREYESVCIYAVFVIVMSSVSLMAMGVVVK